MSGGGAFGECSQTLPDCFQFFAIGIHGRLSQLFTAKLKTPRFAMRLTESLTG